MGWKAGGWRESGRRRRMASFPRREFAGFKGEEEGAERACLGGKEAAKVEGCLNTPSVAICGGGAVF